ncbi:MAG: helix-turn-helix transcriptional regulator [Pirellulales bacterium]|nr:helix-turn-helix transcriptional regulator [Pirellulales bacterium]
MKPKKTEKLSDQLRRLIEESSLSRYEISKRTGIAQSTLCKLVQGERGISTKSWDLLGECLDLRLVAEKPKKKGGK